MPEAPGHAPTPWAGPLKAVPPPSQHTARLLVAHQLPPLPPLLPLPVAEAVPLASRPRSATTQRAIGFPPPSFVLGYTAAVNEADLLRIRMEPPKFDPTERVESYSTRPRWPIPTSEAASVPLPAESRRILEQATFLTLFSCPQTPPPIFPYWHGSEPLRASKMVRVHDLPSANHTAGSRCSVGTTLRK